MASEYMAWVDHQVIGNLPLRLAKNWGSKAKDHRGPLGWLGSVAVGCVPNYSYGGILCLEKETTTKSVDE